MWGVLAAVLGLAGVALGAGLTRAGARQGRLEERRWQHIDTVRTLLAKYEWTFDDRRAGISSEVSSGERLALRAALLALRDPVLDKAVNALCRRHGLVRPPSNKTSRPRHNG